MRANWRWKAMENVSALDEAPSMPSTSRRRSSKATATMFATETI
jgi:hypothetical protein